MTLTEVPRLHWLTLYDPDDGQPYGQVCGCYIGVDHDGTGTVIDDG